MTNAFRGFTQFFQIIISVNGVSTNNMRTLHKESAQHRPVEQIWRLFTDNRAASVTQAKLRALKPIRTHRSEPMCECKHSATLLATVKHVSFKTIHPCCASKQLELRKILSESCGNIYSLRYTYVVLKKMLLLKFCFHTNFNSLRAILTHYK